MIKSTVKEVVKGALKLIETVSYSDGSKAIRVLNCQTSVPDSVVFIDKNGNKRE